MATYFITLRTQKPSLHQHVAQYVRAIKRATHPNSVAANLHKTNALNQHDPHIHRTIETDDLDAVKARIHFFLPTWKVSYCQVARNTTATLIYAASKLDAEPIFFRGSLDEQC